MKTSFSIIYHILFFTTILWTSACEKTSELTKSTYPALLEHTIDLFFLENKNDTILHILENMKLQNSSAEGGQLIMIFKSAALAETNRADSARSLLRNVNEHLLTKRGAYYYNSIKALILFRQKEYASSLKILQSLQIEDAPDQRSLALNERIIARILTYYENYKDAIRMYMVSSRRFQDLGLTKSVSVNNKFLANTYTLLGSFSQATEKLQEAEKTFIAFNDADELFYLYTVAVNTYIQMNQPDKADKYAGLALKMANYLKDPQKCASIYCYMGDIALSKGANADAMMLFKKVGENNVEYFGSERRKATAFIRLATIYNSQKDFINAASYARKALQEIENHTYYHLKSDAFKQLSVSYRSRDTHLANIYLDSAQTYLQSHHDASTTNIVDFVNIDFQLKEATHKIDVIETKAQRRLIYLLGCIVVILCAVIYHVYWYYKKKIDDTSIELVRKNITQINREKRLHETIQQHKQYIRANEPYLTNDHKADLLFQDFKEWLTKNKAYLNQDLNLNIAAQGVATNRTYLSAAINQQGVKFTEMINKYRIAEVVEIFENSQDQRHHLNLEEIASAVGFNSKSAFFEAFRKETGMTPNQFREYIRFSSITAYPSFLGALK